MNTFNITINAGGRWYGKASTNTPEEAYNKVLNEINIDEPHTTIDRCFCEHCEIYNDEKSEYIYPDDKEFTEVNPQNYDVSIVVWFSFNIDIEAETLEKAREEAWKIWVTTEYPSALDVTESEIEGEDD